MYFDVFKALTVNFIVFFAVVGTVHWNEPLERQLR